MIRGAPFLYLDAAALHDRLPMPRAMGAMRIALSDAVENPLRVRLGNSLFMPARVQQFTGIKVVSTQPGSPLGTVTVYGSCGAALGMVDGAALTLLRTGAVAGLATELLARRQARTLAMLGAGALAPYQVAAVCSVRAIDTIVIWSRTRPRAKHLAEELLRTMPERQVMVAADADDAVSQADVVCCATPAREALFAAAAVRHGTHVNAMGAFTPDMVEVPGDCVRVARVFVEDRAAAQREAGDLLQAGRQPDGTIADILAGRQPPRRSGDEITLFKSVGVASEDVAAAVVAIGGLESFD